MTLTQRNPDTQPVDRDFAPRWYQLWIDAWNLNRPEMCYDILTDDFILDSPTTRHTGLKVQGPDAAADYIRYVLRAYPDLKWEVIAPPLYDDNIARVGYSWRGTGHFTGVIEPPGAKTKRPRILESHGTAPEQYPNWDE